MKRWTPARLGEAARAFQGACVLAAAAELDVFTALSRRPTTAARVAADLACDPRGTAVLLDALAALGLLVKSGNRYRCAPGAEASLAGSGPLLPGIRHLANCLRRWAELARVVKTGRPAPDRPSILGPAGDRASFIGAMHGFSEPVARSLIGRVCPRPPKILLDVAGGSGTWTMAFLRQFPDSRAALFDLPSVVPMAARRLRQAGLADRVRLAAGDYLVDPLPSGADTVWLSAVVHQNSRSENRRLFASIRRSLRPGGLLLIRDVIMEESRTAPVAGALFAVNMLVGTRGGGTFTLGELRHDLEHAGFKNVRLVRRDPGMHSVVSAVK